MRPSLVGKTSGPQAGSGGETGVGRLSVSPTLGGEVHGGTETDLKELGFDGGDEIDEREKEV